MVNMNILNNINNLIEEISNNILPKKSGRFRGVSIGNDDNGIYVFTHRSRSKSYPDMKSIPNYIIKKIESTG